VTKKSGSAFWTSISIKEARSMKHRIEVRVKNKEKVLDGRVMKLPARLVHWLFGDGMKVLVITPGDTVGHVDIYPETAGKAAAK